MVLKRLLRRAAEPPRNHRPAEGQRLYAIGDIHGRLDLLDRLLAAIADDDRHREMAETLLIFLGDLVDRGPDSKGVVDRLMELKDSGVPTIFLKGNHEEILIRAWEGDRRATGLLNRVGGRETLLSYGVSEEDYERSDLTMLTAMVRKHVPEEHIRFLDGFDNWYENGDYLFVHAGVRPGVAIAEQKDSDLRWIRTEFLTYRGSHGKMVVHGHSISDEIDEQPNRIGIDTGAFASNRLTAIGLQGEARWYLAS